MDDNKEPLKKEVGGMKFPDGFAIGPLYFSKDGKTASVMMQPAVVPFDFSVTNALNRLNKGILPPDEFQTEFNSLISNLVADTLIYFQNRIKPILQGGGAGHFNDMGDCVREYKKVRIEIKNMCDFDFLKSLSDVRGRKQHSDRRYDIDYTINGVPYDTTEKLLELTNKLKKEIHDFDGKLAIIRKDYDVKVTQTPNSTSIEFTALNHAFDLTRGGKVVPPKPKPLTDSETSA